MIPNDRKNTKDSPDRRIDGPSETVDEGVVLATVAGVGPAIDHMAHGGVRRDTAVRALSSPEFHREPKRGTLAKVLRLLSARFRIGSE
jgi:hypothetical protein